MLQDSAAMVKECEGEGSGPARERRRFGRFGARLPMAIRRDDLWDRDEDDPASRCRLHLQDLSIGGIRAESTIPLKVNERLTMRLPPVGPHRAVELTGRVRHCRRHEDRYLVGVEFCQTQAEAATSPWRQVSRLFSIALDNPPDGHPKSSRRTA